MSVSTTTSSGGFSDTPTPTYSAQIRDGYIFGKFIEVSLDGVDDLPFRQADSASAPNFFVRATPYQGGGTYTFDLGSTTSATGPGTITINNVPNVRGGTTGGPSISYQSGDSSTVILERLQGALQEDPSVASASIDGSQIRVEFRPSSTDPGAPTISQTGGDFSPSVTPLATWQAPTLASPYELRVGEIWTNEDSLLFVLDTNDVDFQKIENWNESLLYTTKFELVSTPTNLDGEVYVGGGTLLLNDVSGRHGGSQEFRTTLPFEGEPELALNFAVGNLGPEDLMVVDPTGLKDSPLFLSRSELGTVKFLKFVSETGGGLNLLEMGDLTQPARDHLEDKNPGQESSTLGVYFEQRLDLNGLSRTPLEQIDYSDAARLQTFAGQQDVLFVDAKVNSTLPPGTFLSFNNLASDFDVGGLTTTDLEGKSFEIVSVTPNIGGQAGSSRLTIDISSINKSVTDDFLDLPSGAARLDVVTDPLGSFSPFAPIAADVTFSVNTGSNLVTATLTSDHNIRSGDFVVIEDRSVATGSMLGGVKYGDAILGYFEVTVTGSNSFTFKSNSEFTSDDPDRTLSALDTAHGDAAIRFVRPVSESVLDSMLETASSTRTGSFHSYTEMKVSTQSDGIIPGGAALSLEEFSGVSFSSGGAFDVVSTNVNEAFTTNKSSFLGTFGLYSDASKIISNTPSAGIPYLVTGDLLANTPIEGSSGDDILFAGAAYDPTATAPPYTEVDGGSGNDTLLLLGDASDYAIGFAEKTLGATGFSFDVDAANDVITVTSSTVSYDPILPPSIGDTVYFRPIQQVNLGGQSFALGDNFAVSIESFQVTSPGWSMTFRLPDVDFDSDGTFAITSADLNLLYKKSLALVPVDGETGVYSLPQGGGASDMLQVEGKGINSFSNSSDLLSTVISGTRLTLNDVERVQFVSDWPLGPAAPQEIDLGYLPRNDIKIKKLADDHNFETSIPESENLFRILDASGRSGIVIDSATKVVQDYSNSTFGDYGIGEFGGYIVSGSNIAFTGRSDLSEIVIVEGAGTDLNFALNGESFEAGDGGHFNAIAFTGQAHGVTIDLGQTDLDGYVTFTNGQSGSAELEGIVRGARAVFGSTQDDVIKGLDEAESFLSGGGGNDNITGGNRDDWIIVGGESSASGGSGDDIIVDWGASTLTGGAGKDTFFVGNNKYVDGQQSTFTHITDFAFALDGASRPGRSSSWEDRVGLSLSFSSLQAMGVFGASATAQGGKTLSVADYQALRNAIQFDVSDFSGSTARVDAFIRVDDASGQNPLYQADGSEKLIVSSFTVDTGALSASETVTVFSLPDSPWAFPSEDFAIPGMLDVFDLLTYKGLDGGIDLTNYESGSTEQTIGGSLNDAGFDNDLAIANDLVFLRLSMERSDANMIRPDFPPNVQAGAPLSLFARNKNGEEIAAKFEGSNANEKFVGGAQKDEYRFVKEEFYRDETTVDPVQSFGRDLIVERDSFRSDSGVRDIIVATDLDVSDAVFRRTEIGREGEVSLRVTWDEDSGLNAGDVSVLRQYSNISSMFRVEDIELSNDGESTTYDLGVTKARGAELHTSDARDAILVGRDDVADTFVVNAGTATGAKNFDLHLWGLDESDTLRFEGMGALKSFVAAGATQNVDYIEHSATLSFVGVSDNNEGTTDDSWTVNATFHQKSEYDFDFMKLVVDPDGKPDDVDHDEDSNTPNTPNDLVDDSLILFDDTGSNDGLYEFELNRPDATQEAGLSFDGETVDIYLLDGNSGTPDNEVTLIGFVGETTLDNDDVPVYGEEPEAFYDDTSFSNTTIDIEETNGGSAAATALISSGTTEVELTTDGPTANLTATLNFVDEELEFVSFADTNSTLSELDLATVAS